MCVAFSSRRAPRSLAIAIFESGEKIVTMSKKNDEIIESSPLPNRNKIIQLQEAMRSMACKQPDPRHFFAPGMYLRELVVPAGMLMVGKIHKHEHFLMVLSGRAEVISEFGRDIVEAGHISVSPAGVKRVVLALEDTQFVTVHVNPTDTHDLELVEAEHIEPEVLDTLAHELKEKLP